MARIDGAHDGELLQMLRAAVRIGADVQDNTGAFARGKGREQGRAQNALDAADVEDAGSHSCAGVARRDESLRVARCAQACWQ